MARALEGIIIDTKVPSDYVKFRSWEVPQYSRSAVYDDVAIRGRSEPHSFYSHTEAKAWNFTIHFIASFDQGDGGEPRAVTEKRSFLESFLMPDYGSSPGQYTFVKSPHLARIRIRKMFDIVGQIRNLNVTYEAPYDMGTGEAYQIDCGFSFIEHRTIDQYPQGYADIRRLTFRGQDRFT